MIYANYGFPFQFVCGKDSYEEIRGYYVSRVSELMNELEMGKKQMEAEAYLKMLKEYENALSERIPLRVDCNRLRIDADVLERCGSKKGGFMKTFAERLEKVRPYRNDISHKSGKYDTEEKERIADEIREWVKEYEVLFSETTTDARE